MERISRSPIAIIGFGIRFPGGVHDEQTYWDLICNGKDGIVDVPKDRWDVDRFYDPDPNKPGKMYVKKGGFLQEPINEFDAMFFGVTPREADCMDPQQRLILQVVWEALHHAGVVPESLAGSNTGVYVGAFTLDNLIQQMGPLARDLIGAHTAVGSTMTILSNRISYLLDLRGPSLSMDTACSSSLVALHHACQTIWNGESNLGIVGGVNVMFRPEYLIAMCKGKFLAADGYCKSFDERADGYARGEGAGALILKPLAQAEADGDIIHGIIRATGVNQDGRSNGITSPNKESQIALMQSVHASVGVVPDQISYVEAHGTGTQAGDTAESSAIGEALGKNRELPLPVGSVKANIGHLEAASGIAGLVKASLCLKNKTIAPVARLQNPNPNIPFADLGLHLPRTTEALNKQGDAAYAAVNSFGYGGTNAHVLLKEVPERAPSTTPDNGPYVLPVSAKDKQALIELVARYKDVIQTTSNVTDLCYSAAVRRGHYQHRVALTGVDKEQLIAQCDEFISWQQGDNLRAGEVNGAAKQPVFVFTGMGPQWWAMGQELLQHDAIFRDEAERCDAAFKNVAGWSILEEMCKDEAASKMASTTIAQPANFVIQSALTASLKARGINPSAIVGHSVGEVSAAYVSGVLTLEEAAMVSYYRSQIQSKAAGLGGMLAVGLSEQEGRNLLAAYAGEKVDIAAVNGPTSLTLSGDTAVLQIIAAKLEEQGIFNRALQVEVAYHSPYMDPLMAEMRAALASLQPKEPDIALYSTVTGKKVESGNAEQSYGAEYWCQNARQAVLFAPAMTALLNDGYDLFLEVGPHPVLSTSIKQCAADAKKSISTIATLNRKTPEVSTFNLSLAELYACGCELNWVAHYPANARYEVLPAYPWQKTGYWAESEISAKDRLAKVEHPILGMRASSPDPVWSNKLNTQLQSWLPDHCVEDLVVLPGAGYVELGLTAHQALHQQQAWVLEDLNFFNALIVSAGDEPEIRTAISQDGKYFAIHSKSRDSDAWQAHAKGRFSFMPPSQPEKLPLEKLIDLMRDRQDHETHYHNMSARKLQYGPCFQGVQEVWQGDEQILARVTVPEGIRADIESYFLHPAILDACFQSLLSVLSPLDTRAFVPTNIRQIRYYAKATGEVWCYGRIESLTQDALQGSLTLCDASGKVLVELAGIKAVSLSQSEKLADKDLDNWLYEFEWQTIEQESTAPLSGRWLLIGDLDKADSLASRTADALIAAGNELDIACYGDAFASLVEGTAAGTGSPAQFRIAAHSQEDYAQLFSSLQGGKYQGFICFAPQDTEEHFVSSAKTLAALAAVQGLARTETTVTKNFIYVTENAQPVENDVFNLSETGIVALLRVAANEYQNYQFRNIDISSATSVTALANEILSAVEENETVLRGESRKALRMVRRLASEMQQRSDAATAACENYVVNIENDEVYLQERSAAQDADKDTSLKIHASTLARSELINSESHGPHYGLHTRIFSGEVINSSNEALINKNVLLFSLEKPTNRIAVNEEDLVFPEAISKLTPENLASILAYTAAYRIVHDLAQLQAGQSILIHEADSPVGLAAVHIAHEKQAQIFVTVKDADIAEQLISLGVAGCYASDTLEYCEYILAATANGGVDVVLNSFAGEIAEHNIDLLKQGGCLIDFSGEALTVKPGIHSLLLSADRDLFRDAAATKNAVRKVCENLGKSWPEIDTAVLDVKALAEKQYLGSESVAHTLLLEQAQNAELFKYREMHIEANATYLITGGFGGFGKGITRLLANKGAKNLLIVSRSGAKTEEDLALLEELKAQGIHVLAPKVDIANAEALKELFASTLSTMPPLKGVIHTAGVLDDSPINFITEEKLARVMGPKVLGAWNLHENTKDSSLDFFVTFSSVASMIGAAGQGTYVISNVWLDSFSSYRQSLGLPATAISWGALGEVGMAAVDPEVVAYFERVGLRPISPLKAIASFEHMLNWGLPHVGLVDMDWSLWGSYYPAWAKSLRYAHLVPEVADTNEGGGSWIATLADKSDEEQVQEILQRLIAIVAKAMKMPAEKISGGDSLPKLGIDSLIAMELQTVIQQELTVRLSTLELMKGNSLQQMSMQIRDKFADRLGTAGAMNEVSVSEAATQATTDTGKVDIDTLDDRQLEEMLAVLSNN